MGLDIGTIVEVRKIQAGSFQNKIPYRGFYIHTLQDTDLTLESRWITLSSSSPIIKVFTDSDIMKQKVKNTTLRTQVTVETLLDLSDRVDTLSEELQDLKAKAITKASDFVTKENTFWYSDDSNEKTHLTMDFPSHAKLVFKTNHLQEGSELSITPMTNGEKFLWTLKCPVMEVASIKDNSAVLNIDLSPLDHRIQGNYLVCNNRIQYYNSDTKEYIDVLSYMDEKTKERVAIPYPLGDNATFNDVKIREGGTLYLDDPNARIKIKKPKEII